MLNFNGKSVRLGRKAIVWDSRRLMLGSYMTSTLPDAPAEMDWTCGETSFGEMLNDSIGDCLPGDTLTVSPGFSRAYRALYDGPVINIVTRTGKRLTTTCNHPVLTSRGFIAARLIKSGDYVLSSNFPKAVAARIGNNLQDAPSTIEDIFKAHERVALPRTIKRKVGRSVDFHGDAKLFKSKVDIVDTKPFLRNPDVSCFGQPERQTRFILASKPRHFFNRLRSFYPIDHSILLAAPSVMGFGGVSTSFLGSKFYRPEQAGFAAGSYNASFTKNGVDSSPADSELPGKLLRDFSGQVQADEVLSVDEGNFRGHVYDASTNEGWYIANGILSHNCTIAGRAHAVQIFTRNATGTMVTIPDSAILAAYESECGYNPADPSTDRGGIEADVLTNWRNNGFAGHSLLAFADCSPTNLALIRQAIALFGGLYIGMEVPNSCFQQQVWDVVANDGGIAGGHCVYICGYTANDFTCITWGALQRMTVAFWSRYVDEAHCLISQDFISATGLSPSHFRLDQLQADLAQIH